MIVTLKLPPATTHRLHLDGTAVEKHAIIDKVQRQTPVPSHNIKDAVVDERPADGQLRIAQQAQGALVSSAASNQQCAAQASRVPRMFKRAARYRAALIVKGSAGPNRNVAVIRLADPIGGRQLPANAHHRLTGHHLEGSD